MAAIALKWIIIAAAVVNFGFMVFDGTRGLTKGDYMRPKKGQYAGQLGPWSKVVKTLGLDPESTLMKMIFVGWGIIGLMVTFCFAIDLGWAWKGMLFVNIGSLWYLMPGTVLSISQIILLIIIRT